MTPAAPVDDTKACECTQSDAWRCAVDRSLRSVACHCECHRAAAPVGDDAELVLRLHDLTAPEYIDGHPWASEHDRVLLEAADRLEALARENVANAKRADDWYNKAHESERKLAAAERCIRAADAMARYFTPPRSPELMVLVNRYDAARAGITLSADSGGEGGV